MQANIARSGAGGVKMTSFSKTFTGSAKPVISELIGKNGFVAYKTGSAYDSTVGCGGWFSASDNFGAKGNYVGGDVHTTFDAATGEILVYNGDSPNMSSRWGNWTGTYIFYTW